MKKRELIVIGIFLFSIFSMVQASKWEWRDATGIIRGWFNSTGSINITEDFICPSCINPEDIGDVDSEDIETDLNTFVDIAGDAMTGNLGMGGTNITQVQMLNITNSSQLNPICIYNNGTHIIWESC